MSINVYHFRAFTQSRPHVFGDIIWGAVDRLDFWFVGVRILKQKAPQNLNIKHNPLRFCGGGRLQNYLFVSLSIEAIIEFSRIVAVLGS